MDLDLVQRKCVIRIRHYRRHIFCVQFFFEETIADKCSWHFYRSKFKMPSNIIVISSLAALLYALIFIYWLAFVSIVSALVPRKTNYSELIQFNQIEPASTFVSMRRTKCWPFSGARDQNNRCEENIYWSITIKLRQMCSDLRLPKRSWLYNQYIRLTTQYFIYFSIAQRLVHSIYVSLRFRLSRCLLLSMVVVRLEIDSVVCV